MGTVSTIASVAKCDGVSISFCFSFVVPFELSCVFMNVEFRLLLNVLS